MGTIIATYREIQAQIEQVQRHAAVHRENELSGAIQQIRDLMKEYGITVDNL